ncbi:hypothetical protein [Streptomyces sp. YIM 98790]|uniref:hypothetical protein n=1 Tax=Streptomyces sp. YIM 98790 TaxID=2689077 RepID=UPI00140A6F53|nr:hypothetical protein [Streptomyces sp. YIM 98790]
MNTSTTTGTDGKTYSASRPVRDEPHTSVDPGQTDILDAEVVDEPARPEPPKLKRAAVAARIAAAAARRERRARERAELAAARAYGLDARRRQRLARHNDRRTTDEQ